MLALHILVILGLHLSPSSANHDDQHVPIETKFTAAILTNTAATCLHYNLTLYIGDGSREGTRNLVSVVLHGVGLVSEPIELNARHTRLERGSIYQVPVNLSAPLGELITIELHSQPLLRIDDTWLCDKITVQMCEGEELLFPFYRWVNHQQTQFLRPATAIFESQDVNPIGQKQRRMELEQSRKKYRWSIYEDGLPATVAAEKSHDLPKDVQYSAKMAKDHASAIQHAEGTIKHLLTSTEQWDHKFSGLEHLMPGARSQIYDYVKEHWAEDSFFGYQFLNGFNPMVIQRCSELPKNFPVTEEMVRDSMGGSTLEQEMKDGNIFLVDYRILDGLVGNVVHDEQTYLAAPLVLLYANPKGQMMPIAIQLTQEVTVPDACVKGELKQSPIFLPTDGKYDWLLAKTFVRLADSVHLMVTLWLRTYLLGEVFSMATLRNLPSTHPLYKLLIPHTRYNLAVNVIGRSMVMNDGGRLGKYSTVGDETRTELLKRATASLTYGTLCLPCNIFVRGLQTVPNYYYRDDGLKVFNIINKYVDGVLTHYYKSNDSVGEDAELQNWISEIFTKGFLGNNQTGIPQFFTTPPEVVKFVTMVIFTITAQHAAVQNAKFDFGGWMPNAPFALRRPPPTEKGHATMEQILEALPDKGSTAMPIAVLKHSSEDYSDVYPLGHFPEQLFGEEAPLKLMEAFRSDLKVLSDAIDKRNAQLELPYTPLNPRDIINSICK